MHKGITPHGGKLINRLVDEKSRRAIEDKFQTLKKIKLNNREISDLEMIAVGAFSPLEGFMLKKDYESALQNRRLANGIVWTLPITLSVSKEEADNLKEGTDIGLVDELNKPFGVLHLEEKYTYDREKEAKLVYLTTDMSHPGVDYLHKMKDVIVGGKVSVLSLPAHADFANYRLAPLQSREVFFEKGWKRIVGFQTRNPVHRAHEYIQKCALEIVDGLFLHPLVGETKSDDIPAKVRMRCYETLLDNYYPKDRVILGVLGAAMRYAGPREAIHHAMVRKNYGCTHFIVGRDHAGVGKFYGTFDAQKIFDDFTKDELGITPLFFDNTFYCRRCEGMASVKTCSHDVSQHVSLSGTQVRDMLKKGVIPPHEFTRPEVAEVLIEEMTKR